MSFGKVLPVLFAGAAMMVLSSFTGLAGREPSNVVNAAAGTSGPENSTVAVMAWFGSSDTLAYWLHETQTKIAGSDTVRTLGFHTKVLLSVADSTEKGYAMEMNFVDFRVDTPTDPKLKTVVGMLSRRMLRGLPDMTLKFNTDEVGRIVSVDNERQFRKTLKSMLPGLKDLMPGIDSVYAGNPGVKPLLAGWINPELIADSYLSALYMFFQFHGNRFNTGEFKTHSDGDEYSTDSYVNVSLDPDSYEYDIYVRADNRIPGESPVYTSEIEAKYYMDGWPEEVTNRESAADGPDGDVVERRFLRTDR